MFIKRHGWLLVILLIGSLLSYSQKRNYQQIDIELEDSVEILPDTVIMEIALPLDPEKKYESTKKRIPLTRQELDFLSDIKKSIRVLKIKTTTSLLDTEDDYLSKEVVKLEFYSQQQYQSWLQQCQNKFLYIILSSRFSSIPSNKEKAIAALLEKMMNKARQKALKIAAKRKMKLTQKVSVKIENPKTGWTVYPPLSALGKSAGILSPFKISINRILKARFECY